MLRAARFESNHRKSWHFEHGTTDESTVVARRTARRYTQWQIL